MQKVIAMSADCSNPILLNNICLDFEFKAQNFQNSFSKFLAENTQQFAMTGTENTAAGFIDRIWPDGLPGSLIVSHASFDNFDRYLIRPPVDGPNSSTFAAGGFTACFGIYRHHGIFAVDSFYKVPHLPLRPFERYVSGPVHINPKTISMTIEDFSLFAEIKRQRSQIAEELNRWTECLKWQKNLVFIGQDSFRYLGYQVGDDGLVRFLARAGKGLGRLTRNSGIIMLAAPLTDSASPDTWQPNPNSRPNFTRLGEVAQIKQIKKSKISKQFNLPEEITQEQDFAVITVKPEFDSDQIKGIANSIIPTEGFLVSSVGGDIKPITSAQRAISRLTTGNSSNCYLPDFCFNITNASIPLITDDHFLNNNPFSLNDDQRTAVNKILSAPDMALLQGPPGTGKTTVIEVVTLLEALQGKRILIPSQTNVAIDNVLTRLSSNPAIRVLRIGASNRIEPEARIFLEDNAPKTWFKAVRKECLKRIEENAKLSLKIKDAQQALDKLEGMVNAYERTNKQLLGLRNTEDSLNKKKAFLLSEYKDALNSLSLLKRRNEALLELLGWLSSPGNSPPQPELANEPQILSIAEKSVGHIAELLDTQKIPIAYAGNKDTSNSISMLYHIHNAINAAEELCDSLNKAELLCTNKNNNPDNIEEWSRLCLNLKKHLGVIFNRSFPPQSEELITSLKPEIKWLFIISQLKKLCNLLTCQCREIVNNTFIKLKIQTEHSLSNRAVNTANAHKKISSLKQNLEDINYQISDLEYEIENPNNQLQEYGLLWQKYWPAACPDLAEPLKIPLSITPDILKERIHQFQNWHNGLKDQINRQCTWDSIRKDWTAKLANPVYSDDSELRLSYIRHANVVGLTCLEAGQKSFYQSEHFRPFDTVIIDEVSKATPPELLMPMMCGCKIVLVGDHRQLPPMCRENERSFTEALEEGIIAKEDFEKHRQLITSSFFEILFYEADDTIKHSLSVQYRMNPQIMACVNQCYDGRLIPAGGTDSLDKARQHSLSIKDRHSGWLLQPHQHVLWIDSTRNQHGKFITEQQVRSSKINLLEIELIAESLQMFNHAVRSQGYGPQKTIQVSAKEKNVKLIDCLKKTASLMPQKTINEVFSRGRIKVNGHSESPDYILKEYDTINADLRMPVGVITFYGAQLGYLRRKIAHIIATKEDSLGCLDIRTNTVDKFQGMEMPIIIVSLVRATYQRYVGKFVKEYRRINVAFSRAQNLLVIVGSELFFRNALIDLPDMNTGKSRQIPVYKNIHNIITGFGGQRYAKQILG